MHYQYHMVMLGCWGVGRTFIFLGSILDSPFHSTAPDVAALPLGIGVVLRFANAWLRPSFLYICPHGGARSLSRVTASSHRRLH